MLRVPLYLSSLKTKLNRSSHQKCPAGQIRVFLQANGSQEGDAGICSSAMGPEADDVDSGTYQAFAQLQQRASLFKKKEAFEQLHATPEKLRI